MVTNFEEITTELTDEELAAVPLFVKSFNGYTKEKPIKSAEIIKRWNSSPAVSIKMTGPRLRKICNHIRSNSLLPLIGTSCGYYVSNDRNEVEKQIKSLTERANSIMNCVNGLKKLIE